MWVRPRKYFHFLSVCRPYLSVLWRIIPLEHTSVGLSFWYYASYRLFPLSGRSFAKYPFHAKARGYEEPKKTSDSVRVVRWEDIHIWTEVKDRISRQSH
jgi:hypothetical protein